MIFKKAATAILKEASGQCMVQMTVGNRRFFIYFFKRLQFLICKCAALWSDVLFPFSSAMRGYEQVIRAMLRSLLFTCWDGLVGLLKRSLWVHVASWLGQGCPLTC